MQGDTNPGVPSRGWHTLVRAPGPTAGQRVDRMGLAPDSEGGEVDLDSDSGPRFKRLEALLAHPHTAPLPRPGGCTSASPGSALSVTLPPCSGPHAAPASEGRCRTGLLTGLVGWAGLDSPAPPRPRWAPPSSPIGSRSRSAPASPLLSCSRVSFPPLVLWLKFCLGAPPTPPYRPHWPFLVPGAAAPCGLWSLIPRLGGLHLPGHQGGEGRLAFPKHPEGVRRPTCRLPDLVPDTRASGLVAMLEFQMRDERLSQRVDRLVTWKLGWAAAKTAAGPV